jgi:uncharacterized protein YkwD
MASLAQLAAAGLVALAVAGAPEGAAAAACARADALPASASRASVARATLCGINAERASYGLQRLRHDDRLAEAARRHSLDMVRRGYFAHGHAFEARVRDTGYLTTTGRWRIGETLAWGWGRGATPREVVRAWMASPGHRKVLLRPAYREVGIGVVWGGPDERALPQATFTADFGVTR